jgi:hypothetical protein
MNINAHVQTNWINSIILRPIHSMCSHAMVSNFLHPVVDRQLRYQANHQMTFPSLDGETFVPALTAIANGHVE